MQPHVEQLSDDWLRSSERRLREHLDVTAGTELLDAAHAPPMVTSTQAAHLAKFNLEWHLIPSAHAVPFDDRFVGRLYPRTPAAFTEPLHHGPTVRERLAAGHLRWQGRVVAVETTTKPWYLPNHKQYYGSTHGMNRDLDPLIGYMDRAHFFGDTRYGHNYLALRSLVHLMTEDWRSHGLLPPGYCATICPPVVFNLIGSVFHPEWSDTPTLEVGWYPEHGSSQCYVVGANSPHDFSYVAPIETGADWTLFGFRLALAPFVA